jgi:DNA-binding protein H-NS
MARIAVDKLSLKQIEELEGRIAQAKAKAAEGVKAELKSKIDALLTSAGMTIGDVYPLAGRGRGKSKSVAKFANPDDRSQTWTGRGRRPAWLIARLKKGVTLDSFKI